MAECSALLARSDDELELIGEKIADPLQPTVAGALSACNNNLWRVMRGPLATLRPRLVAARALAETVGWSLRGLREAKEIDWSAIDDLINRYHVRTLNMLLNTGSLPRIERINFNYIEGAVALFDGLECGSLPRLTCVELNNTGTGPDGAAAFAAALGRGAMPALDTLFFGCNPLGDGGLAELALQLRRRPAIRALYLEEVNTSDDGLAALVGGLGGRELKKLESLALDGNVFSDAGCAALRAAVDAGDVPSITWIGLRDSFLPDAPRTASLAAKEAVLNAVARASGWV